MLKLRNNDSISKDILLNQQSKSASSLNVNQETKIQPKG